VTPEQEFTWNIKRISGQLTDQLRRREHYLLLEAELLAKLE
jgi:hypothetical protein